MNESLKKIKGYPEITKNPEAESSGFFVVEKIIIQAEGSYHIQTF